MGNFKHSINGPETPVDDNGPLSPGAQNRFLEMLEQNLVEHAKLFYRPEVSLHQFFNG